MVSDSAGTSSCSRCTFLVGNISSLLPLRMWPGLPADSRVMCCATSGNVGGPVGNGLEPTRIRIGP
eukprot:4639646-Prymnesium_polylepis.1